MSIIANEYEKFERFTVNITVWFTVHESLSRKMCVSALLKDYRRKNCEIKIENKKNEIEKINKKGNEKNLLKRYLDEFTNTRKNYSFYEVICENFE